MTPQRLAEIRKLAKDGQRGIGPYDHTACRAIVELLEEIDRMKREGK